VMPPLAPGDAPRRAAHQMTVTQWSLRGIASAIATASAFAIGAASLAHAAEPDGSDCPWGFYRAASGDCVPDPKNGLADRPPAAICRDGDYSDSEHPYSGGTCHGHGGVAQVLAP
jgi:hypothetical protein